MSVQRTAGSTRGTNVLVVIGVALVASGLYSAYTLWASRLARYMYLEDLALADDEIMHAVSRATPTDRGLLIAAAVLVGLGIVAIASAAVRRAIARRSERKKE